MSDFQTVDMDVFRAMEDEIKRLTELTKNDGIEIGSYERGTGLRGERQRYHDALEKIVDEGGSELDPGAIILVDIAEEALKNE